MDTNQSTPSASGTVELGLNQEAHNQFNGLQQYLTNVDMITKAVARLTTLEAQLDNNIKSYIAEHGGDETIEEEMYKGMHQKLPLARFKLELVRTTIQRFNEFTSHGEKLVENFAKINPDE